MNNIISTDIKMYKKSLNNEMLTIKNSFNKLKHNSVSLDSLLLIWLENNKIKLKHTTYVKYYEVIINHIIPEIGKTKIKKIDTSLINSFLERKMYHGR